MPTIVVDVMPKAELLDPQGKAVAGALNRLGLDGFAGVRIDHDHPEDLMAALVVEERETMRIGLPTQVGDTPGIGKKRVGDGNLAPADDVEESWARHGHAIARLGIRERVQARLQLVFRGRLD